MPPLPRQREQPAGPRPLGTSPTLAELHRRLNALNQRRMVPTLHPIAADQASELEDQHLEDHFIAGERAAVRPLNANVPDDPDGFVRWFEELRDRGPGQGDPLFPWLAQDATHDEMRWFLGQEVAGEAGFEDLLALTQLRMPARAKLEMARNYWDELGRGNAGGMHGAMLDALATALDVRLPVEQIVWPSLALANLMMAMACHRDLAFQAVGALGVIELTAPGRAEQVNAALVRLGVPGEARRYFALHATLDVRHSRAWNDEVIRPLVAEDPRRARAIAEGALLRLRAGARCFAAYRRHFLGAC